MIAFPKHRGREWNQDLEKAASGRLAFGISGLNRYVEGVLLGYSVFYLVMVAI